jgi:hypothetical protein
VDVTTRRGFLNLAAAFEGATLLLGLVLGWATGVLRPQSLRLTPTDAAWGFAAVVPMLSLLWLAPDLRRQVVELLGRSLAACRWYDLAALALLAGLSEEILFRGVLEPWLGRVDAWFGFVAANLLFGVAHAVTPRYLLFATGVGLYFSLLSRGRPGAEGAFGEFNLLRPIIAHSVYDGIAFALIVRDYQRQSRRVETPSTDD